MPKIVRIQSLDDEKRYIIDRTNVDHETGCWLWALTITKHGYAQGGTIALVAKYGTHRIHKISYQVFVGVVPSDLHVRHKCRNKHCCNPEHLELGTAVENMADKVRDGTGAIGSKQGSAKLTEVDVAHIRELFATGSYSMYKLAKLYQINHTTMTDIIRRKHWKHV